jgi:hypothetical protein
LGDFREVWLVRFEFDQAPGERPTPLRLVAKELHSGRVVRVEQGELPHSGPPYALDLSTLWVAYDAAPGLGCYLALGWPMPARVLDLHAEFRCRTSGLLPHGDYGLADALDHLCRPSDDQEGVGGLATLLDAMLPTLDLPRALLRGRYMAAVARMEWTGIPIDLDNLTRLRDGWEQIQGALIEQVDNRYGVFEGLKFNPRRWAAWLNRNHIRWPRLAPGQLELSLEAFRDMAEAYPDVGPMKELRASLSQLRLFRLAVGRDGRNRCPLRPFASKTGRNQPSTASFIFGPATWLRGLIKPEPGMALAYVDFEQQEFGIAAALSGDPAMMEAYRTGDPYLKFAKQAGAVPADATKATHRDVRDRFKQCALGVQYGMQARSLAARLGVSPGDAQKLLRLHRETYPTYWRWSKQVGQHAIRDGVLLADGDGELMHLAVVALLAPAAGDGLLELLGEVRRARERRRGEVIDDEALAALDGVEERLLVGVRPDAGGVVLGPLRRVAVVQHEDVVPGQVVGGQVAGRTVGHVDLVSGPGQELLDEGGCLAPLVGTHLVPGNDEGLDLPCLRAAGDSGREKEGSQGGQQEQAHGRSSADDKERGSGPPLIVGWTPASGSRLQSRYAGMGRVSREV